MQTPSLLASKFAARQLFRTKWRAVVNRSVHAPVTARQTGLTHMNLLANPKLGGAKSPLPFSSPSITVRPTRLSNMNLLPNPRLAGASSAQLPYSPRLPNMWVDNGVIWVMPYFLVGFTSNSAATAFFSSVTSLGFQQAPSSWYAGAPFSAMDIPILTLQDMFLAWPSLNAMPFANNFIGILAYPGSPTCASGPVLPTSAMQNFSANSPNGVQNFQAQYIMYADNVANAFATWLYPNPAQSGIVSLVGDPYCAWYLSPDWGTEST